MKIVYGQRCDGGLPPQEQTITAGGMAWRYLEWGTRGTPFVLWHGITSDARTWWQVGPFLAGLGFHVYAPDLPGHGLSDDAPGGYAVTNTARLLDAWLAAVGIVAPVLLGHSWGGMNALIHATLPDTQIRARALVLEDPALALGDDPETYVRNYTADLGTPRDEQALAAIAADNPRWHPCDVWWKAQARERARHAAVEGFFRENKGIHVIERLHDLTLPTLLLLADPQTGGIWTAPYIERLERERTAHVAINVIPESGHNVHRDSYTPFCMALAAFVRQYAAR